MEEYLLAFVVFITALILLILALYSQRNPPKKINNIYGYRTNRSMKSEETWDYAQKIAPPEMRKSAIRLLVLSVVLALIDTSSDWIIYIAVLLMLLIILLPIFTIEKKLKNKFL